MTTASPQDDAMAFDDASSPLPKAEPQVPTKQLGRIHIPFDNGMTIFRVNMDVTKPDNFAITVMLQGEHSPVLELESVDGQLIQPIMEMNDQKQPGKALDNAATKFAFPDGIQLEQFSSSDAEGKLAKVVLAHKGTSYTITSRAEGSNYMTKVERKTKDGARESIRFVAADNRPFVTYSKPAV